MSANAAARYIMGGGFRTVEGWLSPGAITATVFLDDWQQRNGVRGNVAEIGIHHGKLFLALKNLCRSGEAAIAIDVFEDQSLNVDHSGRGDRAVFEANIRAHSDGSDIAILQKNSLDIRPDELTAKAGGNIRLFSIDGSHTMEHTLSDLQLASKTLTDGGVIILDDFFSQDWPGVQEGFHHFMAQTHGKFAAVAVGDNKLFLCRKADHSNILEMFREAMRPYYISYKEVVVWGKSAISMALQAPEDVFSPDLGLAKNVFLLCEGSDSRRRRLKQGWSHSEPNGTWTIEDRAVVEVDLVDHPKHETARLQMELVPFLHSNRTSRKIDIEINGSLVGSRRLSNAEPERVEFSFDRALLKNPSVLVFQIESPESPSDLGLSTDQRPLGAKVRSIKFE